MQKLKSKKFLALCKKYGVDPEKVREVLSYEEACKIIGVNPKKLPLVSDIPVRHRKRIVADYKLSIIAEALRDKKKPNYNDTNEEKYFPYFRVRANKAKPSGFGLSCDGHDLWRSGTTVGSRLCFQNADTARFFGCHFLKLHIDHQLFT